MKRLLICLILTILSSPSVYCLPFPPTTEEERVARLEAIEKRDAEWALLEPELYDYDTKFGEEGSIWVAGGRTQFFTTFLQLDHKTGDLALVVECIGDASMEFNLTYNLNDFTKTIYALSKKTPLEPMTITIKPWSSGQGDKEPRDPLPPRCGIMYMHRGETFTKKIKIWERTEREYVSRSLSSWDQLVSTSKEKPDEVFELDYNLAFKINGVFYHASAPCPLTAKEVLELEKLRLELQKTPKTEPKVEYDMQFRNGSKNPNKEGESPQKLEPVE